MPAPVVYERPHPVEELVSPLYILRHEFMLEWRHGKYQVRFRDILRHLSKPECREGKCSQIHTREYNSLLSHLLITWIIAAAQKEEVKVPSQGIEERRVSPSPFGLEV